LLANSARGGYYFSDMRLPMAKVSENHGNREGSPVKSVVEDFVKGFSSEYKMLVVLKRQLYGGRWEPMLDDLKNRSLISLSWLTVFRTT
jgi:hypothetical protein